MKKLLLAGLLVLLSKVVYGQLSKPRMQGNGEKESAKGKERTVKAVVSDKLAKQNKKPADKVSGEYHGHKVYTGPEGGTYYINSHGNKTYIN